MQVLDRGTLGLVDWMGSDRRIAEAAWVSYGKQDSEKPIDGVINYMMKHKHGTPFEHVVFTFHEGTYLRSTRMATTSYRLLQ
jgi:thymidylate synthase (FAD)